eukprot:scaffold4929_cov176-Amphora_coffeaeformis.AAC.8
MLTDVDEFAYLPNPVNNTLPKLLSPLANDNHTRYVSMANLFHGVQDISNQTSLDKSRPMVLLRDFVYHSNFTCGHGHRSKTIIKPQFFRDGAGIHKQGGGGGFFANPYTQLRHNHFKGVGSCAREVKDTSFGDKFADRLEARLDDLFRPVDFEKFYPVAGQRENCPPEDDRSLDSSTHGPAIWT